MQLSVNFHYSLLSIGILLFQENSQETDETETSCDAQAETSAEIPVETEPTNNVNQTKPSTKKISSSDESDTRKAQQKPSKRTSDTRVDEAYNIMESLRGRVLERDECSIYGEQLAFKLRKMDVRTRLLLQHQINGLVFETEMNMLPNYNTPFMPPHSGENSLLPESLSYYNLNGNRPNSTPG
ncbi:uncharacterized protein LOC115884425 [Sitophilus oryzae]|uniref:Uncharacterized protein LOC115884425 n=1 Tax=Sitophilus oryzae TaxID=7048 RepID=A0A6J2Y6K8_SITOR|nr:uncharacterized protein LOC115884425 [Sitophilus oryzae]